MKDRIEFFICFLVLLQSIESLICIVKSVSQCKSKENVCDTIEEFAKVVDNPSFMSKLEGSQQRMVVYQIFMFVAILIWIKEMIPTFMQFIKPIIPELN